MWIDLAPYPGPWYEPDWEEEYVFGDSQPYYFPSRDNLYDFTLPAGYVLNPPKPGSMFVQNGQPVGIVMSTQWSAGETTVTVQVSTY